MNRNYLSELCKEGGRIGHVKGMQPFYEQSHKVYCKSIATKVGDSTEVRGYLVNLMYYTATHKGAIDVMDYLYHEMMDVVVERRYATSALYIHAFIVHVCSNHNPMFENDYDLTKHEMVRH